MKDIDNNLRRYLKQEIIKTSENINTKQYYQYDDNYFENDDQLNRYLASKNKIEKIITTSNIGKVIKDYEFKLLDEEKVYSVNIDDYQLVYKVQNNQTYLDKQDALKTYNIEIDVKQGYSYSSLNDWYDTPTEVQNAKKQLA